MSMIAHPRFVDICTTPRWKYRFGIRKADLTCMFCSLISISIDPINLRIERTATVKVSVFLFSCPSFFGYSISQWRFYKKSSLPHRLKCFFRGKMKWQFSKFTICGSTKTKWGLPKKSTDDRSLIWRTEPDKGSLPLDGFAIDRHFTFYFAGFKANIYTKSTKKLLKAFLNKWCTWINTWEQCYNGNIGDANGFQRPTLIFRFFNIKKMAANDCKHAMHSGQNCVCKLTL